MTDIYQGMVKTFNRAINAQPNVALRVDLIKEESQELVDAVNAKNIVATIDAACDLLYVLYGAAEVFNLPDLEVGEAATLPHHIFEREPDWEFMISDLQYFSQAINAVVVALTNTGRIFTPEEKWAAMAMLAKGVWLFAAFALGVNLDAFFREVHRTNMHKLTGPQRADGKQLKPADWKPPRIKELLDLVKATKEPVCLRKHEYDPDAMLEHPKGGFHCARCGGLYVDAPSTATSN